jgi:hypothetical protein
MRKKGYIYEFSGPLRSLRSLAARKRPPAGGSSAAPLAACFEQIGSLQIQRDYEASKVR